MDSKILIPAFVAATVLIGVILSVVLKHRRQDQSQGHTLVECPRCRRKYPSRKRRCQCGAASPLQFPGIRHFFTKVVGVTHQNVDGGFRQKIIRKVFIYEKPLGYEFTLETEPNNAVDPNAVMVKTKDGLQIGYLSRELAPDVATRSSQGFTYNAILSGVTGITATTKLKDIKDTTFGVNLAIIEAEPGTPSEMIQNYYNEYRAGWK